MTGVVMVTKGCRGEGGGKRRKSEKEENQVSVVDVLLAAIRRSMVSCRVDSGDDVASAIHHMDIGWPTNVRHVAHVTFDRFHGFLGLPVEFELEVPQRAPSASASVFGVSPESMQCSYDSKGNSVPTILLLMQGRLYSQGGLKAEGIFRINPENSQEEHVRDQLNRGIVPEDIDVHCLAGLIKAWFRELPAGVLDSLSPEQVLQCNTEEESVELVKLLLPTQSALLNWAVELMADVVEEEEANKMNARNIAMVFAPNMTQMADPLTALMHAVQVMNLLKTLILKTLREREEAATGGSSPFSSNASDQQIDDCDSEEAEDMSCESREPTSDDDQVNYSHSIEENDRASLNDIEECFLRQLDEGTEDVGNDANNSSGENLAGKNICPGCCSGDNKASEVSNSDFNVESGLSISDGKSRSSSTSDEEDSGMTVEMGCVGGNSYCACYKRCENLKCGEMVDTEGESLLGVVPSLHVGSG